MWVQRELLVALVFVADLGPAAIGLARLAGYGTMGPAPGICNLGKNQGPVKSGVGRRLLRLQADNALVVKHDRFGL